MSTRESEMKQRRRRKTRTIEVPSPSSSSSEEGAESPPPIQSLNETEHKTESIMTANSSTNTKMDSTNETQPQTQTSIGPAKITNPEEVFDEFYLRQATKEFSDDLDKLRSASDFNERSVPMLIEALRQGRVCFSKEERGRVGGAAR